MTPQPLHLDAYRSEIHLDEPFSALPSVMESEADRAVLLDELLSHLQSEGTAASSGIHIETIPPAYHEKRRLLQALLTVRSPDPLPDWFHAQVNQLLKYENSQRRITDADSLPRLTKTFSGSRYAAAAQCALWQGDITTLQVDAIVNAANSQMLGCFQPFHACIDNVIHSAAGPRLREDCATIINIQGYPEGTGWAKITCGYNLPSKFVLHTVGPIVQGQVTEPNRADLANAYTSCLEACNEIDAIRSIAFCGISTGLFGYPANQAAKVALGAVTEWLQNNPDCLDLVVFNVFSDSDKAIYENLLE